MDQFEEAQNASTTALNSYNSAYSENETYLDSYEAKINKMKNSFTEASIALQKSFLGDGIQIFAASVTTMIKGITSLIDNVGLLPLAFATTGIATIALTGNFSKMMTMSGNLMKVITAMPFGMKAVDAALVSTGIKTKALAVQNKLASISFTQLRTAAISSLASIASFALPVAGFLALGFAIQKITEAYMKNKEASEKAKQALENEQKSYSDNKKKIGEMVNEYERLSNARKDGKLDTSSEERYVELQNELGKLLPSVVQATDAKGNSILKSTENIKDQIDVLEELIELEKERKRLEAPDNIKSNSDKINNDLFGLDSSLQYEYDSAKKMEDMFRRKAKDAQEEGKSKERISFFEKEANKWASERKQLEIEIGNLQSKNASSIKTILGDTKLNSKLKQDVSTLMSQLSFKGKDSSEIDTLVKNIGDAVDKLNKAKPDSQGYKDAKNDLKELLNIYGEGKITVQDFIDILSQEKKEKQANKEAKQQLLDLEKMSTEEVIKNANALRINTDETEDNTDATDENTASQQKNISVSEQLAGITNDNISSLQESIGVYRLLSDEENLSADKKQMLANAVANLSDQYPYLVKNGKLRIDQVQREVESSDILLKALDRVTSGTATAEETKTTYAMLGTKNRLEILAKEINAMDQMMKAYQEAAQNFYKDNRNAEGEAAEMALAFQVGLQKKQGKSYASIQSEIDSLIPKLDSYAGKLADVTNYNGQYYKSAENAKKSTDKLAKSYENATYVSDKFKQQLEKINAQLREQQSIQKNLPNDSAKYISSLQTELKLQEQKKKVLEAQSKELEKQIKSGKIQQTGVITTTTKSTTSSSYSKATGGSTQDIIWNFFKQKGLSDSAVAGIMGNLQLESNFNPSAVNKSSGATGIAQWLGGRLTGLKSYAKSIGTAYTDLNTQLQWLWKELNSTENKTLKYLQSNSGSSASTLAAGFERLFERSGGAAVGTRQGYANNIYSKYSGKTVAVSSSGNTSKEVAQGMADIDSAKSELLQLQSDILDVQDIINQLNADIVNAKVNQYENLIAGVDRSIQKSEAMMKQYTSTSAEYRKELDLQASKLKYKQDLMHKEAEYLRQQIASGKLSAAQVAEYTVKVSELSIAWWDVKEALDNVKFDKMTSHLDIYKENVEDLNKELELSQAIMSTYNEDSEEYRNEIQKQITLTQRKIKETQDEAKAIKKLMETEKLSAIQKKALQDRLDELTKSYWDLTSVIKSNEEALLRQREEFADKAIDAIKKAYETERDYKSKLIEQQMDEAEKAHQRQLEMYDEDLRAYEDSINQKLRLIDDQASEDEYNEQLNGLLKEQKDLQSQIFTLSLDDSQESALKRHELEQQLDDKVKEIEKLKKNRNKDLRKQDLNDQLDAYQKDVEAKKKAEDKKYEMERDRLEREKRDNEYYYNELIANESQFQSMREDIIQNGTNNIQGILSQFLEAFKNMNVQVIKEIGMSWQDLQNQIGNMEGLPSKYPSTPPSLNDNNNTTEPIISQRDQAWQQYLQNKLNWETASAAKKKQLQKENEAMREKWKFPDGSYDALKNLKTYHTGGIVGGKETNDTKLIKSFLDLKPNEEFAKLLNEEVVLSKPQVPNLANNIRSLLSSFTPKQMTGGIIQIDNLVNIGNVTKDANINIKQLVKEASNELVNQMRPYGFRL
ncbi:phage tail tip lysozyme [Heyndrickxia oleronia]|uniref:phage tail tip lysozyme n=1 Tax=Heyndrickxia oleronia TaxID=38875 RepID=UPI003F20F806